MQPLVAQGLYESLLAGFIGGAAAVGLAADAPTPDASTVPGTPGLPPIITGRELMLGSGESPVVRFPSLERAAAQLQARDIITADRFYAAAQAARATSFTISGDLTIQAIGRVRDVILEGLQTSTSRTDFIDRARAAVAALPISDAHLEHVYRNAVNEAYSAGMESVLDHPILESGFPYRQYIPIHDSRTRHTHLELARLGIDGTAVYYFNDPMWLMFRPPWEWQCRCGWSALSVESAARLGVREAQKWLETGIEPAHQPRPLPDFRPPASWQRISL